MEINNSKISDTPWGQVDKTELKNKLKEAGSSKAIKEAFLFVGDLEKTGTWKFPHHQISGDVLVVNRAGVHSAAQRLVSHGQTESDIPKKAAARHLLKHYKAMGEKPPESLNELKTFTEIVKMLEEMSKFASWEEAQTELEMLHLLRGASKSDEMAGIFEEIPSITKELRHLPVSGKKREPVSLEKMLKAISNVEELENASDEHIMETDEKEEDDIQEHTILVDPTMEIANTPQQPSQALGTFPGIGDSRNTETTKPKKSLQEVIESKGLDVTLSADNKTLVLKGTMSFSNSGKRTVEDYKPTAEELGLINKNHSNVDLEKDQLLSFTLRSADMAVDRSYEHFTNGALERMAQMSVGKAFLMDHDWNTTSHIGKIYDAAVKDGKLMQKVYVLNDDFNRKVVSNMLAGIYDKVSVGFGVDLNEMKCDSCGTKSYYDESCPHTVGNVDEKGGSTAITIKDINDYYEVSLVPVPAQRDAGISRSAKAFEKSVADITSITKSDMRVGDIATLRDMEFEEAIPNDTLEGREEIKNSDTINNDKSILGDSIVANDSKMPDKESGVPELDEKKPNQMPSSDMSPACANPGVPELDEKKKDDVSANNEQPDDDEDDKRCMSKNEEKSSKALLKEIKKSIKKLTKAAKKQAKAASSTVESNEKRLKQMEDQFIMLCQVVEAAATNTVDPFNSAPVSNATKSTHWLSARYKELSGGQ